MLDLFQALAAAPGIDHRPTREKHIGIVAAQRGQRLVRIHPATRAMFGIPGDRDGKNIVAAEIICDLGVGTSLELAFEHALRRRHERRAGLDVRLVHRMDVNIDGSHDGVSS